MKEQQKSRSAADSPAYTVQDVAAKITALDREVKYLLNKAKTWKPKKPKITIIDSNSTKPLNDTNESGTASEKAAKSEDVKLGEEEETPSQDGQPESTLETPGKSQAIYELLFPNINTVSKKFFSSRF